MIAGADIFLGLSAAGVLKPEMVAKMAPRPVIFALANPTPEILPEEVHAVRSDAIVATGRTDYPNQVNNVLCFPYIFRGALDSGATTITIEMEIAAVHAIAELAQAEPSEVVTAAYAGASLSFGPEYLIPKPFDPRLMMRIAPAVAKAAAESGVAARPIADMEAYRAKLQTFVYASGTTMRPIFNLAKTALKKRIAFAEGEEERVLRAVQVVVDENLARPTLIGRPEVIAQRDRQVRPAPDGRARLRPRQHRERPSLPRLLAAATTEMTARKGVTAQLAKIEMRRRLTLIGSMLLKTGEVDGMLCGTWGSTAIHLHYIDQVIGLREGAKTYACMNGADPAGAAGDAGRHPRQLRPERRADRRDHGDGGRGDDALRPAAEGGAALAQQLRLEQPAVGGEDARGAGAAARARAPGSRSTARCTATPRSTVRTGTT